MIYKQQQEKVELSTFNSGKWHTDAIFFIVYSAFLGFIFGLIEMVYNNETK